MPTPPKLTPEARVAALEAAKQARRTRAIIKEQVRTGELKVFQVIELASTNDAIAKMRVSELLVSIPGIGKVRVASILDKLGISETRRIQGLGVLQLQRLKKEFSPQTPPRQAARIRLPASRQTPSIAGYLPVQI